MPADILGDEPLLKTVRDSLCLSGWGVRVRGPRVGHAGVFHNDNDGHTCIITPTGHSGLQPRTIQQKALEDLEQRKINLKTPHTLPINCNNYA